MLHSWDGIYPPRLRDCEGGILPSQVHLAGEMERTPAEFDISPYLQPGGNFLAAGVYQYSDGSYLEDQDMFRLSGIFRDVSLWSADKIDLRQR